jgi:phage-related minor tail protein
MAKGSNRIRTVNVAITANISGLEKQLKKAQKSLRDASKNLKSIGEAFSKNVTVPIVAVGTALAAMTLNAAKAADDLNDLSSITGISTTQLQEMSYAGTILGTDLETMTSAQTKLTRSVFEATKGNKEAIKAFQELGIQIYDNNGNLKDANTIFWEVLDALGKIEDPILRDGLAMQLMGKSAQELNPLIKAGSEEIKKYMEQAERLGLVLGPDQVKQLADLNDAWDTLKLQFAAAGSAIAAQLAPYLLQLFQTLSSYIPKVVEFIQGLIDKFLALDPGTQKFILTLVGIVAAIGPLLLAGAALASAIAFIATPVGLVVAAIVGLIAIGTLLYLNWDTVCKWFKDLLANTWANIKLNIETDWNAIKWFFTTIWNGIKTVATTVFNAIKGFFEKWGPTILTVLGGPIGITAAFIIKNWETIKSASITIFEAVKSAIVSIWDGIVNGIKSAVNTITGIVNGVMSTIAGVINAAASIANIIPGVKVPEIKAPQIPKMAEGGILTAPQLVMAGEAGPEAIIPLDKLGDISSKPTIVQVILDGRVIQEYMDRGLGNSLAAFGGA